MYVMFWSHSKEKMLYYSADPSLTIQRLKSWDIDRSIDTSCIHKQIEKYAISCYVSDEAGYHFKCLKIPSKPYILYTRWDTSLLNKDILWIVWPRKPSVYAERIMKDVFQYVSMYDVATISWWANGIDYLTHSYSIEHGIPTIVVLWWGILHYLQWNKGAFLQRVVNAWGLVLSEFKLWQDPTPRSFPQRNRIIAWLCDVLFFPAAWERSWSLITVDFALKIRTPVYTVPWSIYEATNSWSNAYLTKWKVKAVTSFVKLFKKHFHLTTPQISEKEDAIELTVEQQCIIDYISLQDVSSEQIAVYLDKDIYMILSDLTTLEMMWRVSMGKWWKRMHIY